MTGRLTVDLNALAQNYRTLAALDQGPCSAVIKADAYGLGMSPVA
ncbi:MAG TPA: alanine racemase, partial [Gammaproteobacteria bacterium]|nr:alanine racemase [Gammaproteobacteria bacterium]